jgi:CHC2 zinc finger/Toprim-like
VIKKAAGILKIKTGPIFIKITDAKMKKISIEEARKIDLVDYLEALGYHSTKIKGADYWYLSPLRTEKTPSFKINRNGNIWYDHGTGDGGNFIDFGIKFHKCSVSDLLIRLREFQPRLNVPFKSQDKKELLVFSSADEKKENDKSKIVITGEWPLSNNSLLRYLEKRCIPLNITSRYCRQVDFLLYDKKHTAIGLRNDAGGYELRNEYFKGSSSPKASLFIDNKDDRVDVFEGFFNFLSHQAANADKSIPVNNFLILNSLAFFGKQRNTMERHNQINLYLDRDKAGMNCTEEALKISPKYQDQSMLYSKHNDINEWLIQTKSEELLQTKQSQKQDHKQIKINGYGRF